MNRYTRTAQTIRELLFATAKQTFPGLITETAIEDARRSLSVGRVEDIHALVEFSRKLSSEFQNSELLPTGRDWILAAREQGLPDSEQILLLQAAPKRGMKLSADQSLATQFIEALQIVGNTVKGKTGKTRVGFTQDSVSGATESKFTTNGPQSALHIGERHVVRVEIWLSGNVSEFEEAPLLRAIESAIFNATSHTLIRAEPPIRGSFFQAFQFLARSRVYLKSLAINLRDAFDAAAKGQSVKNAADLNLLLAKHDNAVIRVADHLAVKITRDGQTLALLLDQIPDDLKAQLNADPTLIGQPGRLVNFIPEQASSVREIKKVQARRKLKKNSRAKKLPPRRLK